MAEKRSSYPSWYRALRWYIFGFTGGSLLMYALFAWKMIPMEGLWWRMGVVPAVVLAGDTLVIALCEIAMGVHRYRRLSNKFTANDLGG
jgi:hypothetical protein